MMAKARSEGRNLHDKLLWKLVTLDEDTQCYSLKKCFESTQTLNPTGFSKPLAFF